VPELGPLGSMRGASSNGRPYREHQKNSLDLKSLFCCTNPVHNYAPMIYGYARVSTDGQSVDAQVKQLRDAGAEKVFRETASGARSDRAQLRRAIIAFCAGRYDQASRPNYAVQLSLPNYSSCFGLSGVGVSGPLFVQRRPTVFRDFGGATFGSSYPNSFWRRALISLELTLNALSRSWRTF
jgi:hypothetical protein